MYIQLIIMDIQVVPVCKMLQDSLIWEKKIHFVEARLVVYGSIV